MSFNLLVGGTLSAGAGTGAVITMAVFGDEIGTGDSFKKLFQGTLATGPTTVYTVTGPVTMTIIKVVTLVNTSGSAVAVTLFTDGTAAANRIPGTTVPANGTAIWENNGWVVQDANGATIVSSAAITATGDATGVQSGSTLPLTLATFGPGAIGPIGDATHVAAVTVDAKGRVSALTSVAITFPAGANAFGVVTGNTGTANADSVSDTLAITGANGITTAATDTPDGLVITGPNSFGIVTGNTGTANSDQSGDTLAMTGTGSVSVTATDTPDGVVIANALATGAAAGNLSAAGFTVLSAQSGTNTGDVSLAAVALVPNANAATLTGQVLNLQVANASFPGVITAAQFVVLNNTSGTNSGNVSLGGVGVAPNANAATLTGQVLNLELASAAFPGVMSAAQFTKLASLSGTNTGDQNLFLSVTGNTGTATADTTTDTLAITGANGISTAATDTPDGLVITGGNNFGIVTGNTGTANSDVAGDTLAITGSGSVNVAATDTPDGVVITNAAATLSTPGNISSSHVLKLVNILSAQADFGFVDDLRGVGDGACSTGAPTKITSATAAFVSGDNGKRITLAGAGAAGAMYVGVITAIDSGTQVTVSPSISTTVSTKALQLGTDNSGSQTNLTTFINTTAATYPGFTVHFEHSTITGRTGRYGMPNSMEFTRPVILQGDGRGFTADQGVADQVGGTWLCWWGTTADGGTPFGGFISFRSNQANNMKGTGLRDLSVDCSNGSEYGQINQYNTNALWGVKLATVNGFSWNNVFIRNAAAMGLWCDIDSTPTEQESTSRGIIANLAFRCLDSGPSMITTPFLMTSAVTLTASGQSLTVAANTLQSAGYIWTATTTGRPVLVQYTGGGGTTTLTGCRVSTEDAIYAPVTVNGGNIVSACPANSTAALLSGSTTANTNLCVMDMWQVSHGTTWGPAGIELANADSIQFRQIVVNGGSATVGNAINRVTKPGVRFNGHDTNLGLAARNNVFYDGDPGVGGVVNIALNSSGVKLTAPAGPNYWWGYQLGNAAPAPTIEAGGYLDWSANGGFAVPGLRSVAPVSSQSLVVGAATQVAGSVILMPPQAMQVGTTFRWRTGAQKSAAGVAVRNHHIRVGTTGTVSDAIVHTFAITPTAIADDGEFEILYTLVTVNSAASQGTGFIRLIHSAATNTGLSNSMFGGGSATNFTSPVSGLWYISLSITTGTSEVFTIYGTTAEVVRIANQAA